MIHRSSLKDKDLEERGRAAYGSFTGRFVLRELVERGVSSGFFFTPIRDRVMAARIIRIMRAELRAKLREHR